MTGCAAPRFASRPLPLILSSHDASFSLEIPRAGVTEMFLEIGPPLDAQPSAARFDAALERLVQSMRERVTEGAALESTGRLFNEWIDKSRSDLALLTTTLPTGPYPYAGIPWFATQFGRDAIITALQTLWLNPALAAGVLRFLALTQAHEESAFRDAEPGKIMHEMRRGEMAVLQEVPFQQYYGGVDTTPLFVMLAGAYEERTGDAALVDEIWPNLLEATAWIERRLERSPMVSWITRAVRSPASSTRAGRTVTTRSSMPTAGCRVARSRSSKCRVMHTRRCSPWRSLRRYATCPNNRGAGVRAPRAWAS